MTKKNFEAIAGILKFASRRDFLYHQTNEQTVEMIVNELSRYFDTVNPNFNRAKFLAACEPDND